MQTTPRILRPAQNEVHRAAHEQDLIEVPKRAMLDREVQGIALPAGGPAHGQVNEGSVIDPASPQR
jgi:hypothetical protein